jgi:hypothetical protein
MQKLNATMVVLVNIPNVVVVYGFEKVIAAGELAEIRIEANGTNICRSNTSNGYVYKQYVNYNLIPKEMGLFKHVIQQFKDTVINLLNSEDFSL